jgi:Icc-related predicted phosphoesterase
MMKKHKIIAISDTHCRHRQIKAFKDFDIILNESKKPLNGDIIIHAGDALNHGTLVEFNDFIDWFSKLDFTHKIYVPGNHDMIAETDTALVRQMCKERRVILLIDEEVVIDGVKMYGSPQTPYFNNWSFNCARNENEAMLYSKRLIKDYWDMIPDDVDILITHGPPYGILDELTNMDGTLKGQFLGCVDLLNAINRIKPEFHFFGHIHAGYGQLHKNGTSFYNLAVCDEMYNPSNPITVIDYEKI